MKKVILILLLCVFIQGCCLIASVKTSFIGKTVEAIAYEDNTTVIVIKDWKDGGEYPLVIYGTYTLPDNAYSATYLNMSKKYQIIIKEYPIINDILNLNQYEEYKFKLSY